MEKEDIRYLLRNLNPNKEEKWLEADDLAGEQCNSIRANFEYEKTCFNMFDSIATKKTEGDDYTIGVARY